MGINVNSLRFLLSMRLSGVDFSKTATIGRQGLHMSFEQLERVFIGEFSLDVTRKRLRTIYSSGFAEELFSELGARKVESFDYSEYEAATHTHDFNRPISDEYKGGYTVVFDGGSLEHVFNFPIAIKNCMEMVSVGGAFLASTPTNNYSGHGFYQFSPELYYRVLSPSNGFRVDNMFCHMGREASRWYVVPDPARVGHRVQIRNALPTPLLIRATRIRRAEILDDVPLQSDYVVAWSKSVASPRGGPLNSLKELLPTVVKDVVKSVLRTTGVMPAPFERVNPGRVHLRMRNAQIGSAGEK